MPTGGSATAASGSDALTSGEGWDCSAGEAGGGWTTGGEATAALGSDALVVIRR